MAQDGTARTGRSTAILGAEKQGGMMDKKINLEDIKNRNWGDYGNTHDVIDALIAKIERLEKENGELIEENGKRKRQRVLDEAYYDTKLKQLQRDNEELKEKLNEKM